MIGKNVSNLLWCVPKSAVARSQRSQRGGGGGVGGRRGGREGLPYILKVFVCVYLSQLLLGVSPHSGCVVCLVWVGEVGLLSFLS